MALYITWDHLQTSFVKFDFKQFSHNINTFIRPIFSQVNTSSVFTCFWWAHGIENNHFIIETWTFNCLKGMFNWTIIDAFIFNFWNKKIRKKLVFITELLNHFSIQNKKPKCRYQKQKTNWMKHWNYIVFNWKKRPFFVLSFHNKKERIIITLAYLTTDKRYVLCR